MYVHICTSSAEHPRDSSAGFGDVRALVKYLHAKRFSSHQDRKTRMDGWTKGWRGLRLGNYSLCFI